MKRKGQSIGKGEFLLVSTGWVELLCEAKGFALYPVSTGVENTDILG